MAALSTATGWTGHQTWLLGQTPSGSGLLRRQPVAHSRLGQEIARSCGLALELVAQVRHVDADVVRLLGVRRPPHFTKQLLVRDDLAGVMDERRQALVLDRREADLLLADFY